MAHHRIGKGLLAQGKQWKESALLSHTALQQPAALISFVTEVTDLHNVTQKSKPHHCHLCLSRLGGEKTRTELWQTLRRHMSMKKMTSLITILAEIRLSLHTDDDDSGSTRQQERQEGDSVKPCQERTVGSKKGGSCYATGVGSFGS